MQVRADYQSIPRDVVTKQEEYEDIPPTTVTKGAPNEEHSPVTSVQPFHIVFSAFFGSVGVAFSAVPILIPEDHFKDLDLDIIPFLGRALCSFILFTLSAFFVFWKLFHVIKTRKRDQADITSSEKIKLVLRKVKRFGSFVVLHCPSLLQIFVFAIGSMLTCALDISDHLKDGPREQVVFLLQDINRLLAILFQMIFFSWYSYDNHRGTLQYLPRWHHLSISAMIGAQVWLWVSDTTEPLWKLDADYIRENFTNATNESAEFTIEHFLEPFHVEFATISIGLLYGLWNISPTKTQLTSIPADLSKSFAAFAKYKNFPTVENENKCSKLPWLKHITFATILAFIYTVLSSLALYSPCPRCDYSDMVVYVRVMFYRGIFVLYLGALLPISSMYALWKLSSDRVRSSSATIGQYLLVITAIVVFVYYFLRIFAAGYDLHYDKSDEKMVGVDFVVAVLLTNHNGETSKIPSITHEEIMSLDGLSIIYPFLLFFQVWTQTQLLIEAGRHKNIPDGVKKILIYIIAINFAEWLQTGISIGFDRDHFNSQFTPIMNNFYTDGGARIIRLCLNPFIVLYRFHSAVVAWEVIVEDGEVIVEDGEEIEEHRGNQTRRNSI